MKPQSNHTKTALVVEDSPVQALALCKLLERFNLNTICAPNGLTGLSMAQEQHPDVIILDIQMPEMDGLEACRRLQQDPATAAIPVIMLTARSELAVLRTSLEGGAADFIPKDAFSDVVLLETLRQLHILAPDSVPEA